MAQQLQLWEAFVGLLVALGIASTLYRYAYELARFGEQMDAIGSTTPTDEVEPTAVRVGLMKLFAVGVGLLGLAWFLDATAVVAL